MSGKGKVSVQILVNWFKIKVKSEINMNLFSSIMITFYLCIQTTLGTKFRLNCMWWDIWWLALNAIINKTPDRGDTFKKPTEMKRDEDKLPAAIYILIQSEFWQYTIISVIWHSPNSHQENPLFVTKYIRLGHIEITENQRNNDWKL